MVWIHGGGYATGSGRSMNATAVLEFSPDTVWVFIEYRLNAFGFLGAEQLRALDPEGSCGNYGLQDQRLALAWARRSIHAYGGNPAKITIDGCSAGAGSTANHMVNAKSWPYFDQAMGESGVLSYWNTNTLKQ